MNEKLQSQLNEGIGLLKCRKCKCMMDALDTMKSYFSTNDSGLSLSILEKVNRYIGQMEQIKYT